MAINRYRDNSITINTDSQYKELFKERGISKALLISFRKFKKLRYKDLNGITIENYRWKSSDRFYKLSEEYYGDSVYWWIIALFNNTPLESDVKVGQNILIPTPLERVIEILEY
tara:strand:- start:142 stop:483 length:342 start_codon:yes stop_codon:yes gene_type:complete